MKETNPYLNVINVVSRMNKIRIIIVYIVIINTHWVNIMKKNINVIKFSRK